MKLIIENLSKKFDQTVVLKDINFTFEAGKIYGLLGRNGSGKTTFFNCINEDIRRDSGTFTIETDTEKRKLSLDEVGYVLSTPVVPEFLTGREFLKFFMDIHQSDIFNPRPLDEYFDYIGINKEARDNLLKTYSHGMKNKMQMLISIIASPNLLLLDEPLTSLDVVASEDMKHLLRSFKGNRITILSTHILDLALDLCDEIVLLSGGTLDIVDKANLDNKEFREKIIDALKEADNA